MTHLDTLIAQHKQITEEILASLAREEALCIEQERLRRENQQTILRALDAIQELACG